MNECILDKTDSGWKVLLVTELEDCKETALVMHTCSARIREAEAGVPGQPGIRIKKAGFNSFSLM